MSNQTPNPYTTKSYIDPDVNFYTTYGVVATTLVAIAVYSLLVVGSHPTTASIMGLCALGALTLMLGTYLYNYTSWLLTELETDSRPTSIDCYGKAANGAEIGLPPEPNMSYEEAAKIFEEEINKQAEKEKNMPKKTTP